MSTLFVGLGAMGEPMARNLAGLEDLYVYDLDANARDRVAQAIGATALSDLATVPEGLDLTILMVPNSRIVESLLTGDGGLFAQLRSGALVIDMSSSEPASTRELAATAAAHGIGYVDAPVSGGVARAITGTLAIMSGGSVDDFERARPVLAKLGADIIHVGEPGAGHAAKALNNLLSATNIAAASEVLIAATGFGIAPETMLDVINVSTGRSQATEVKFPKFVLTGSFDSGFGMDLMLKDLAIARSLTSGAGLESPVTDAAATVAGAAREFAQTPPDHTEIIKFYEHASGAAVRTRQREKAAT